MKDRFTGNLRLLIKQSTPMFLTRIYSQDSSTLFHNHLNLKIDRMTDIVYSNLYKTNIR